MLNGDDILLNSKEVAQILDCSPDTVMRSILVRDPPHCPPSRNRA